MARKGGSVSAAAWTTLEIYYLSSRIHLTAAQSVGLTFVCTHRYHWNTAERRVGLSSVEVQREEHKVEQKLRCVAAAGVVRVHLAEVYPGL